MDLFCKTNNLYIVNRTAGTMAVQHWFMVCIT